jgi:hypothetical protein
MRVSGGVKELELTALYPYCARSNKERDEWQI